MPVPDPSPVFNVKEYITPNAQKIVLFFCPFGIKSWQLALPGMPIWHLRKNGYSVLSYSYPTSVATVSVDLTLDYMDAVIYDAQTKIAKIPSAIEIIVFGTSLGTVLAANVAARHDRIKKVILNLSYADISDHIVALPSMRTIPSQKLRKYLSTATNETEMRAAFDPYSPLSLARLFHDKKLLVYSSKDDPILKQIHTAKFRAALKDADIDFQHYENMWGRHYFAALVNYLRFHRWLNFLKAT